MSLTWRFGPCTLALVLVTCVAARSEAQSFGFSVQLPVETGANPWAVALGDLNGDGNVDLVVANEFANTITVRLGDGRGGFGPSTEIVVESQPLSVAIADLSGDGKLDVAVANAGSDAVSVVQGATRRTARVVVLE